MRPSDTLARYGGEEFAVLLPGCDLPGASEVIERLRSIIPLGQACSAGVARWDGIESQASFLARADARLYAAKDEGRDRLVAV